MAEAPGVCGDGRQATSEACDDGGKAAGDGCSSTCTVEPGYTCVPGAGCKPVCGDGTQIAAEACDDGNHASGDGCSDTCGAVEAGWECKTVGKPCSGICGDGIIAGELCDDKNLVAGDGCSAVCVNEADFICDVPGSGCRKAPSCSLGVCTSTCGDGIVLDEVCDDGNVADGDGCSASCTQEAGWTCLTKATELPAQLAIPVTYRDFVSIPQGGSTKHPDQQAFAGADVTPGLVAQALDADGLPVYTGVCEQGSPNTSNAQLCPFGAQTFGKASFDQWFRDVEGVNLATPSVIVLNRQGGSKSYVFDGGDRFSPLTGRGFQATGQEAQLNGHNYGFTTVLRYWFEFTGDEQLEFSGDDDVWVFIGGKLAVDIGGLHPKQTRSVILNVATSTALGLVVGKVYELALLHAERAPSESNFKLTFSGFLNKTSECSQP